MRLRIGLGVWIVAGLALALKIRLLQGLVGEETLRTIVAIDAAAAVLLFLFALATLTSHLSAVREILRSLISFVGGRREQRAPVQGDPLLRQLGQIINEVLSEVTGSDEMSSRTPGFKRVVRPKDATDPRLRAQLLAHTPPESEAVQINSNEGVGPVRVRRRNQDVDTTPARPQASLSPQDVETRDTEVGPTAGDEPSVKPSDADNMPSKIEIDLESQISGVAVATQSPDHARAPASEIRPSDDDASSMDTRDEPESAAQEHNVDDPLTAARRALFESYLSAKKVLGENIDEVDFSDFVDEVSSLRAQIMAERECGDVRFEVKVVDGQVALQPRIIRAKTRDVQGETDPYGATDTVT